MISGPEAIDPVLWERLIQFYPGPYLNALISLVLAMAAAFLINQWVQNMALLTKISNLSMLVIAVLMIAIPDSGHLWTGWVVVLIQLGLLQLMEDLYDRPNKADHYAFNSGALVGVLSMFLEGGLIFFALIIYGLVMASAITLRRIIMGILGVLAPLYFVNSFAYFFEMPFILPWIDFDLLVVFNAEKGIDLVAIAFLVLIMIVGVISLLSVATSTTLRERRRWMIVVAQLVLSALLLINQGYEEGIFVCLVPFTIALSRVFLTSKNRKASNALLLLVLAFVLLVNS